MGVFEAVTTGDRVEALRALRDRLAASVDEAEPGQIAPIARQLALVLAELDEIAPDTEADTVDELRKRRAARLARTDAARGPVEERQSR